MTTPFAKFLPLVLLAALAVACSGDDDRIGSMEEFCSGTSEVSESLAELAVSPEVSPDDLADVRDALRDTRAPEGLRADLDTLAEVIDEVLVGLDDADLSDPSKLAEVQDRLARLEDAGGELQAAADRVFLAIDDCRAAE